MLVLKMKKDLEQILKDKTIDKEMIEMAEKDLNIMKLKKQKYENDLKIFLLPKTKMMRKMLCRDKGRNWRTRGLNFLCRFI